MILTMSCVEELENFLDSLQNFFYKYARTTPKDGMEEEQDPQNKNQNIKQRDIAREFSEKVIKIKEDLLTNPEKNKDKANEKGNKQMHARDHKDRMMFCLNPNQKKDDHKIFNDV